MAIICCFQFRWVWMARIQLYLQPVSITVFWSVVSKCACIAYWIIIVQWNINIEFCIHTLAAFSTDMHYKLHSFSLSTHYKKKKRFVSFFSVCKPNQRKTELMNTQSGYSNSFFCCCCCSFWAIRSWHSRSRSRHHKPAHFPIEIVIKWETWKMFRNEWRREKVVREQKKSTEQTHKLPHSNDINKVHWKIAWKHITANKQQINQWICVISIALHVTSVSIFPHSLFYMNFVLFFSSFLFFNFFFVCVIASVQRLSSIRFEWFFVSEIFFPLSLSFSAQCRTFFHKRVFRFISK